MTTEKKLPEGRLNRFVRLVEPLDGARLEHGRAMHLAALRKDEATFARHGALIPGARGGRFEELSPVVEDAFLREAGLLG